MTDLDVHLLALEHGVAIITINDYEPQTGRFYEPWHAQGDDLYTVLPWEQCVEKHQLIQQQWREGMESYSQGCFVLLHKGGCHWTATESV